MLLVNLLSTHVLIVLYWLFACEAATALGELLCVCIRFTFISFNKKELLNLKKIYIYYLNYLFKNVYLGE